MNTLSVDENKAIANKIKNSFYHSASIRLSLFLCGASITNDKSLRKQLADYIDTREKYSTDLIYPEDIFDELLYGSSRNDLLSLEVLLADSVDTIVIIPESAGAFTELGAFTHDEKLREKIICVIDNKYKDDKSFINQGPLRLIKKINKNHIQYYTPSDKHSIQACFYNIMRFAHAMKRNASMKVSKISLLKLEYFLLPTIYLLEPIDLKQMVELVKEVTEEDKNAVLATRAALSIMTKKRLVFKNINGSYQLTKVGFQYFQELNKPLPRNKKPQERDELDTLRLEIYNWKLRNKHLKL